MSKARIETDEHGLTRVWIDGVKQEKVLDIEIDFGMPGEPKRLRLTHLLDGLDFSGHVEADHVFRCGYCGSDKENVSVK